MKKITHQTMSTLSGISQCQAILVSLVTVKDVKQFKATAETAMLLLEGSPTKVINTLVMNGALLLLANRLILAFHEDCCLEEASPIANVMGSLLCCDSQPAYDFISQMGHSFLEELINYLQTSTEQLTALQQLHGLLGRLGSLPWATLSINRYRDLVSLLQEALRQPSKEETSLSILEFLSGLSRDESKKAFLVDQPSLVDDVLEQVRTLLACGDMVVAQKVASISCRLFHRLAWGAENRAKLAPKRNWTDVLFDLAENPDKEIQTQALEIIQRMSTELQGRRAMARHQDAAIINRLIRSFDHPESGYAGLRALSSLIDSNVAKSMKSHPGVYSRLAKVAMMNDENDSSIKASQILKRMASHVSVRDEGHGELLDALLTCAASPRRDIRRWAARGLQVQSESSTNAFFIARSHIVLQSLIVLSADPDNGVRKSAIQTLFNAANEASNTRRAASTSEYLDAFVSNVSRHLGSNDEELLFTSRISIKGILKMAEHPKCHQRVAKQKGVVESLARYGISTDHDGELKTAALHAVLLLTPFI